MSEEFDIQGQVKVDTGDAEAALQKLRDKQAAADKAATAAAKKASDDQLAAMNKVGTAAVVAGAAIITGLGVMVKESAGSQTALLSLAQGLKNTGQYSDAAMTRIETLTDSLRKQTAVSDETQMAALTFAGTMHLTETQAEALLPRLLDLSAVTGMDLQQGFRASAQAMTGNVGLFQRYGVIITKNKDGTVDFNDVLRQLAVYAGQAGEKMSGAEGSGKKLTSALNELGKSLGNTLIPEVTQAANGLTTLIEKFNDMPTAMKAVITKSALVAGGILLIGGTALKTIVGIAKLKESIDLLTAGAGWASLMKFMGMGGIGGAVGVVGASGVAIAAAAALESKAKTNMETFNQKVNEQNGIPAMNSNMQYVVGGNALPASTTTVQAMAALKAYNDSLAAIAPGRTQPDRTWTPAMQAGLTAVQAGKYTSPAPVSATADQIAGNLDLQHQLYDASHTEKQQELHDLDLDVAAWKKAGLDKVLITETSAARRAEIEKKYAAQTAKDTATAASWSPINVSGVNVSGLSSYIGSLAGAVKVKKAELQLTLKVDGTSIKVDQSALSKLKETLGALVYAKVMSALGGSAAFGG